MTQPVSAPCAAERADRSLDPVPLHAALVFLARFHGSTVPLERLRESLVLADYDGDPAPLFRQARLAATKVPWKGAPRATELPLLLLDGPRALVLLSLRAGRLECHEPGIEGTVEVELRTVASQWASARAYAVRPELHFDQRSLLYTLPQAGRWFWDTFDRNRGIFAWALVGTLALNVFGALLPFYSMAVYDRVMPHNALGSLGVLTTAALLLAGFELVMRLLRSHLLEAAARRIDLALSSHVFAHCLRMRADKRPASGGVLANTVRDFESVRDFFATGTLTVLGDLPFMLLYLAVIALVAGWLVVVPLACIPVLLGIALMARRSLGRRVAEGMRESAQRTAHLFETMNALDTVKALGAEAWSRRKWEGLTQAIAHNTLQTREISARVNYAGATVLGLANIGVVACGAWLAVEHALTLGQIIAASMLAGRALLPVSQIAGLIVRWEQTKLSYQALDRLMAAPGDEAGSSLQAPPLAGAVEFRDVSFAYPNQPAVVERINLRIRAGERVGIIGRLGAGKSTLLKLLLNQHAPTTGSVLVDELVVTQIEPLSLRRQLGYVPQDVTLFHGTLRENVELGRVQPDDAALLAALRVSGLDEIVAQLPAGVGTEVGERGERLSGGQRQAVAIARALLAKPRLLLLDEPSSMADPATEQKLVQRLRALPDTTILLVTHRMAMLGLVDRLVVMDRGRIVADGPRDEVLKALAQQQQLGQQPQPAQASPGPSQRPAPAGQAPTTTGEGRP